MSDLAFNLSGEPFDLPPTMAAWRVRKMKPKGGGTPEVVYGLDGLPLILPLDADIEDLRREARGDGRYRLDPVDEHNRAIPATQPAYVCVPQLEPAAVPTPTAADRGEAMTQLVSALLESQKQHTELARMYVSQFPVLVQALSGVVRSAGEAGLPAKVPLVIQTAPEVKPKATDEERDPDNDGTDEDDEEDPGDDEDEEQDDDGAPDRSWANVADRFLTMVEPGLAVALPGLAAALPGLAGRVTKRAATTTEPGADSAPTGHETAGASAPDLFSHLHAIRAALEPREAELVALLADEMPLPAKLAWANRLHAMPIAEAVRVVRAELAELERNRPRAASATPGATAESSGTTRPAAPAAAPRKPAAPVQPDRPRNETPADRSASAPSVTPPAARSAVPAPTGPDTGAHIAAIQAALTTDENAAMRSRFAALSQADRESLVTHLLLLPVTEAIAMVRAVLAGRRAPASTSADAPATGAPAPTATAEPRNRDPRAPGAPAEPSAATIGAAPKAQQQSARAEGPRAAASPTVKTPAVTEDGAAPAPKVTAAGAVVKPEAPAVPREKTPAPEAPRVVSAPSPEAPSAVPPTGEVGALPHLAKIEAALTEDERTRVDALITSLSPDDREEWLDRLLSLPVADGAAFLRDAVRELAEMEQAEDASGHGDGDGEDQAEDTDETGEAFDADDTQDDATALGAEATAPVPSAAEGGASAQPTGSLLDSLPMLDAAAQAHFQAIQGALTFAERMRVHELAAQRPASELRAWTAAMLKLSIPDAVAKVRELLAALGGASNPITREDVS